jgi:hypothetical protein
MGLHFVKQFALLVLQTANAFLVMMHLEYHLAVLEVHLQQ